MTINNANVEQINVALLDIDKRIKALNIDNEAIKSLQNSVKTIKGSLNETKAGLQSGATYNINISGNATTATKAATATTAAVADRALEADSVAEANYAKVADTATKAVEVVDYGSTSRIVRIGYAGSGVTADKVLYLAGYTGDDGSSVKIKDVSKEEIIKWLELPRIKYADYKTESLTFSSSTDQKKIELSNFGPEVTEDNVLSFMVIYWTGVYIVAQGDWAKSQGTGSSGLKCSLHALTAGTGRCVIRCVYLA